MHNSCFVDAELNLTSFCILNRCNYIRSYSANLRIRQWFADTGLAAVVGPALITVRDIVVRGLRSVYVNVYLAADVLFCVGTPLLIISASAGWWLLPEVSYMSLIIYSCVISIIFFAGFYDEMILPKTRK